ncbi:hypothetical protein JX265_005220 [Neoarthrinium moseri]|uniref:Uncharacterized protein n=1 Tax=Neoarthrinium moseri TaxID=1658444 RepID=A0A9P9WPR4_9PEZI|nr:hypothetical protein JX265_005220 [Neoarthrinium moseri]
MSTAGPWQSLPYRTAKAGWSEDVGGSHSPERGRPLEHGEFLVRCATLLMVLDGVAVATKTEAAAVEPLQQWFLAHDTSASIGGDEGPALPLKVWQKDIGDRFRQEYEWHVLASLSLAVAFLHDKTRQKNEASQEVSKEELDDVWQIVRDCLVFSPERQLFTASRSAQGFLSVPLCSLQKEGNIDLLYRLHIWLPDGKRGNPDFAIHSHQCFAQSWILAGQGKDNTYDVTPEEIPGEATHAEFALVWSDVNGSNVGKSYKTHQKFSRIENTRKLVCTKVKSSSTHTAGMSYTIPEAAYHTTTVSPKGMHATLFVFDSRRGFKQDAGILGPKYEEFSSQSRDPDTAIPSMLARKIDVVRKWERLIRRGRMLAEGSDLDGALSAFDEALKEVEAYDYFPNAPQYKHQTQGDRAKIYLRFGKYKDAENILRSTVQEMAPSVERVELEGELALLYGGMKQLDDYKQACKDAYDTARRLNVDHLMCRTVGALGLVNYLLYLRDRNESILELAIFQLQERVYLALKLKEQASKLLDPVTKNSEVKSALTRASIGYGRLSLCYEARQDVPNATAASLDSLKMAIESGSASVIAMSRYFYGRALLQANQSGDALRQFNPPKTCTPAMALCMEPSDENREYLKQIVEAGADMDLVDEQGYTALDYAVYNGNLEMVTLLLEALRRNFGSADFVQARVDRLHHEAKVRRGYREIFQEKLRPILLEAQSRGGGVARTVSGLRRTYANALGAQDRSSLFDKLRYVKYTDFVALGRLPHSEDVEIIQEYDADVAQGVTQDQRDDDFVIFISYRWIYMDVIRMIQSPDNPADNRQYLRMIRAVNEFLLQNPSISRDRVGIWIDSACINQKNPGPGVSALPILLAQCDVVISLVDRDYYNRAWCCIEVAMVQQLSRSYKLHHWYEHKDSTEGQNGEKLERGPIDKIINMTEKQLTYESDRPKVLFLERQSRLLGRDVDLQY